MEPQQDILEQIRNLLGNASGSRHTGDQLLQELMDKEEIRELTARYAQRRAFGVSMADLYTDDGRFCIRRPGQSPREVKGRAALDSMYGKLAQLHDQALGMLHNHLIQVEGDRAFALTSIELRITEAGKSMIASGYYEDEFRREKGLWKFVVRSLTFFHYVPLQQGWAD
jgi:ketosteroid isomerase-like protein